MRYARGFSLLELMIALAVVAILASVGIPVYSNYVEQARRADAMDALQTTAQRLERCFSQVGSYNDFANCSVANNLNTGGFASPEGHYAITAPTLTATTFTLQAAPQNQQSGDECGTFTLQEDGVRGAAQPDCWR